MKEKYPLSIRILHWLIALCVLSLIGAGWYMTGLAREDALRPVIYDLHKSFGVAVLALASLRLLIRLRRSVPPFPVSVRLWEAHTALLTHRLLYAFAMVVPVLGYLMSDGYGFGVKFFDVPLPKLFPTNRTWAEWANQAHAWLAYTLLALIALHVAGALKHLVMDRINLFKRIV